MNKLPFNDQWFTKDKQYGGVDGLTDEGNALADKLFEGNGVEGMDPKDEVYNKLFSIFAESERQLFKPSVPDVKAGPSEDNELMFFKEFDNLGHYLEIKRKVDAGELEDYKDLDNVYLDGMKDELVYVRAWYDRYELSDEQINNIHGVYCQHYSSSY